MREAVYGDFSHFSSLWEKWRAEGAIICPRVHSWECMCACVYTHTNPDQPFNLEANVSV